MEAGKAFAVSIEILPTTLDQRIYDVTLQILVSRTSDSSYTEWAKVYQSLLDRLPFNDQLKDAQNKLISAFSDLSAPLSSRCASVHILMKMMKMPGSDLKSLLPKASAMCKDYNWEVRKTIAGYLEDLFDIVKTNLSQKDLDENLFEELIELMDDEEVEVSSKAIQYCKLFGNFSPEVFEQRGIEFLISILDK